MRTIGSAIELLPAGSDVTDRGAWLDARRAGVSASEIGIILGLSRWGSTTSLFYDKLGALDEEPENWLMSLGKALEPYILSLFAEATGLECERAGLLRNGGRPWQLATPDALTGDIPIELKTAQSLDDWGPDGSDQVPIGYRSQVMWQIDTIGAEYGYLAVLHMRTGEPHWYRIEWDAEDAAIMREAAQDFLKLVESSTPPDVDASEATRKALKHVHQADPDVPDAVCGAMFIRRYRAALRREHDAVLNKKLLENMARETMGQSVRLTGPEGELIATRRIYTRPGYVVKESVVDALYAAATMRETGADHG